MSESSSTPWQKQVICRYFAVGSCQKGDSCTYSHDPQLFSQSSLPQVASFGGEVFYSPEYSHQQEEFTGEGEVVDTYLAAHLAPDLADDEAVLQHQDHQYVDSYPPQYSGEVIDGEYGGIVEGEYVAGEEGEYVGDGDYVEVGEGEYGEVEVGDEYDRAAECLDATQEVQEEVQVEEEGEQVKSCFDSNSCHIQGLPVEALSVGVNTMSLDPCSDPSCLPEEYSSGQSGYPTSPTYIVYTPMYPSPGALSPGQVPVVSGRIPLVSPPTLPLVSPTQTSAGGSTLSPPGTRVLSPPAILPQTPVLSPGGPASTLQASPVLQQTSPGGPHQTVLSVHVHPNVAQVMTRQSQVVPQHLHQSPTKIVAQQTTTNHHETNFQSSGLSVNQSPPSATASCQNSGVHCASCSCQEEPVGSCNRNASSQQGINLSCWNHTSCLSVVTSSPSSSPNQTVINKGCSLIQKSTLNPNTAEFSPCRPSVPQYLGSAQPLTLQVAQDTTNTNVKKHRNTPQVEEESGGNTEQLNTSITHNKCTSQNKGSTDDQARGQATWKAPSNWVDAPEFVPQPSVSTRGSVPVFVPKVGPDQQPASHQHRSTSHQVQQHCATNVQFTGTSQRHSATGGAPQQQCPGGRGSQQQQQSQQKQQQQRSWAQVVNSNIVKQGTTSLSVSEAESQLCPYYRSGECRYGNICVYMHGDMCDYCGQNVLHPHHHNQRKAHLGECLREHERDMELSFAVARSKEKTCGICMEIVLDKPKGEARFGILPSCNHCFCLPCIRKWRQAKQFEHKIIRACPECRQTSDFICPSRFWVETTEQKDQLLAEYKKNLGLKECKYFNKGSGECPFGNKCFYQHADKDGRIIDVGPPRKPQRRVNADGNLSLVQRLLLYDFLEEREGQLVLPLDFVELFDLYSDSDDWSENEP